MHVRSSRLGAIAIAAMLASAIRTRVLGDEPTKPTASASEANPAVPAPGHSVHGEAFNDGPRHAAYLMPGMGKIHFRGHHPKPEAQAFIDQGVAQLHSFYYFEAERSFRQAAKLDPELRHGLLGHGDGQRQQRQARQGFLKEARKRAGRDHAAARRSISRRSRRSTRTGEPAQPAGNCLPGARDDRPGVPRRHRRPRLAGDGHLAGFGGNGIGSRQARRHRARYGASSRADASRRRIITASTSGTASSRSAPRSRRRLYARTAPGIAHAWHMPGHTYTGLKRYADAAYQQEGSARVDHAYMIRDRVMPFEIHNYAHNNQWLCTS